MKRLWFLLGLLLLGVSIVSYGQTCANVPAKIISWFPGDGNATDVIGGHTGVLRGMATYSSGLVGQAFDFTANGDCVEFPQDNEWRLAENDFSIELWAYFRSIPPTNDGNADATVTFVGADDGSGSERKWFFGMHNSNLALHLNDTCANTFNSGTGIWLVDAAFVPSANEWYHIALVRNGDLFTIYVNGTSIGSQSYPGLFPVPDPIGSLFIGNTTHEDDPIFNGKIDELTIYGRALCASEISAIYNAGSAGKCNPTIALVPPAGLVAWFPGDGNANEIIQGQAGVVNGGVSYSCSGKVGESFLFSTANGYIEYPNTSKVNFTGPFTVEAWINYYGGTGSSGITIVTKGPDCNCSQDWAFNISANRKLQPEAMINGSYVNFECSTVLTTSVWHHVTMVYDGSHLSGYVDGVIDGFVSASGPVAHSANSLRIGAYAPVNGGSFKRFLYGQIDELSAYNRALSAAEILEIYNAGPTGKDVHAAWAPLSGEVVWLPADQNCSVNLSFTDVVAGRSVQQYGAVNRVLGFVNTAYSIDGSDYVFIADDVDLNPFTAITAECWIKQQAPVTDFDPIIKKTGAPYGYLSDNGYSLEFNYGHVAFWVFVNNGTSSSWQGVISSQTILPNVWYHVAGVYDGTGITIYVNGAPSGTATATGTIVATANPLEIGHDSVNSRGYNGLIDEATVYCRALSADEVNKIYTISHDGKPYATFTH